MCNYLWHVSIWFLFLSITMFVEYVLFNLNSTNVVMLILLDWMSLMLMSFVLFISSMVIFYSKEYMHGDLNLNRFILLVVLFVLSIVLLMM